MALRTTLHETCQQYIARRLSEGWRIIDQKGFEVILRSPEGIIRPVDIRNDTETLRPSAPGDETGISYQIPASGAHWDKVADVAADDDSTYVRTLVASYERDLYNLPASSGSGTINFIKIYFRVYRESPPGYAKPSLKSNGTVTDGTEVVIAGGWNTWSQQWNTNPAPPGTDAWTWDDIDALQIGVSLKGTGSYHARCTQVYVEVDFTEAPPVVGRSFGFIMG